jgi:hypothetical protein
MLAFPTLGIVRIKKENETSCTAHNFHQKEKLPELLTKVNIIPTPKLIRGSPFPLYDDPKLTTPK